MIKKEFREIIIPALSRLATMALFLVIAMIVVPSSFKISLYVMCLGYVIFWIANCYGISAFKSEYRDNAFEYLLSFPLSKSRILMNKILPRLAILSLLTVIYEILAVIYIVPIFREQSFQVGGFALFEPLFFPLWVAYFLFAAITVGLFEWKSLRILIGFVPLLLTIFISLGIKTLFASFSIRFNPFCYLHGISFTIGVLIATGIMGAAFVSVYRKFDLRAMAFHKKKFVLRSLPALLLLTAVSIIFTVVKSGF